MHLEKNFFQFPLVPLVLQLILPIPPVPWLWFSGSSCCTASSRSLDSSILLPLPTRTHFLHFPVSSGSTSSSSSLGSPSFSGSPSSSGYPCSFCSTFSSGSLGFSCSHYSLRYSGSSVPLIHLIPPVYLFPPVPLVPFSLVPFSLVLLVKLVSMVSSIPLVPSAPLLLPLLSVDYNNCVISQN